MANDFTANPWTIDTPYATAPSSGHIAQSMVRANYLTWTNAAAGATLLVKDRNGKTIMNAVQQATANVPIVLSNPGWVNGLFVPTLSSGVLSVGIQK